MTSDITLGMAFMVGILGSLHCVGMCCGINGGYFMHLAKRSNMWSVVTFHGIRITTYALLGIAGALFGRVLVQSGIVGKAQGLLMIIAGVLIIALGLNLIGLLTRKRTHKTPKARPSVSVSSLTGRPVLLSPIAVGFLNGMVPCSLVFSVAIKAASTTDPVSAGLLMLSFGLGTLPSMLALSFVGKAVGFGFRGRLTSITGGLVVMLGLWTLYQGLIFYDVMRGLANW